MASSSSSKSSSSKSSSSSKQGEVVSVATVDPQHESDVEAQRRTRPFRTGLNPVSEQSGDRPSSGVSRKKNEWPVAPNTTDPPNEKVDGKDISKLDKGLDDLYVAQVDGAYAVLHFGGEKRLVAQADLQNAIKKLARAVQLTY